MYGLYSRAAYGGARTVPILMTYSVTLVVEIQEFQHLKSRYDIW